MTDTPATRRINRGRGHSYLLDGDRADGVTWITGNGVPKPAIARWAAREAAGYSVDHWDELADVGTAERLRRIEGAPWAARDAAAGRGTEVHRYAQQLAAGEEVTPPDELVGHVDAYLRFVDEWHPTELLTEATVLNRRWRYMGTLDAIAELADGRTWILDFKTSQSGVWPETALQLAAYRHAEHYLTDDAELELPQIDAAGSVWLRADGYDLLPVDAGEEAFRAFLYAQQVARFTAEPRERWIGEAARPEKEAAA